ncbi:hypothetical protein Tco_0812839 [Tanacetum coccineum]
MANSSGSSFWNVDSDSPSTTPIIEKIDKIEKLIIDGRVTLVDDEGKPLEKDGYGTQSLLEQWKGSYENDDYEYDPYDDDMYEGQEIPDKLQAICDNLDITVRGRRKKLFSCIIVSFIEIEDVVKEVEQLSCKDVAKETVCLFRHGQKRELYMMTCLQMMADESHLSIREKHTFVSKMNLGRLD